MANSPNVTIEAGKTVVSDSHSRYIIPNILTVQSVEPATSLYQVITSDRVTSVNDIITVNWSTQLQVVRLIRFAINGLHITYSFEQRSNDSIIKEYSATGHYNMQWVDSATIAERSMNIYYNSDMQRALLVLGLSEHMGSSVSLYKITLPKAVLSMSGSLATQMTGLTVSSSSDQMWQLVSDTKVVEHIHKVVVLDTGQLLLHASPRDRSFPNIVYESGPYIGSDLKLVYSYDLNTSQIEWVPTPGGAGGVYGLNNGNFVISHRKNIRVINKEFKKVFDRTTDNIVEDVIPISHPRYDEFVTGGGERIKLWEVVDYRMMKGTINVKKKTKLPILGLTLLYSVGAAETGSAHKYAPFLTTKDTRSRNIEYLSVHGDGIVRIWAGKMLVRSINLNSKVNDFLPPGYRGQVFTKIRSMFNQVLILGGPGLYMYDLRNSALYNLHFNQEVDEYHDPRPALFGMTVPTNYVLNISTFWKFGLPVALDKSSPKNRMFAAANGKQGAIYTLGTEPGQYTKEILKQSNGLDYPAKSIDFTIDDKLVAGSHQGFLSVWTI